MALLFVEKRSIGEHNGGKFSVLLLLFRPRSLAGPCNDRSLSIWVSI